MIWETKGLSLEQVDRMMEEVGSPRRSAGWQPHGTYAAESGMKGGKLPVSVGQAENAGEKAHIHAGTQHIGNTAV
jgi:hypothetical protein